ncbi:diacylglycerol kinase [Balneatrix alpica]|uniref:diacylglycerol kinase n=1 Tax=Balneatrix alpica TaxID=75684 RepID=UPI00273A33E2|nr:diacylglycerol kinase [Balneatrix alpica]
MSYAVGARGWRRLLHASRYSYQGLKAAWQTQAAIRQEVVLLLLGLPLVFILSLTAVERALLLFSLLMVLIVELLNSAIEAAIDRIGLESHPLSGQAKDMGSAAVLVSLVAAAGVWLCVLW